MNWIQSQETKKKKKRNPGKLPTICQPHARSLTLQFPTDVNIAASPFTVLTFSYALGLLLDSLARFLYK